MTNTLNKTIYLKASKADVWAFLTDPEKLAMWFHKPKVALAQGDAYAMYGTTSGDKLMWGDVVVANPYDYLEYTFTIAPMGDATSTVKWTLEDVAGGTRLSLVHEGLPASEEAFGLTLALDKGWEGHFADLRKALHGE
ncbi:MAG TPA: SRPBCC domain-containing protein [Octadecabacter sp.]|nr:SRPBCC domain-containing protein [Octadecabacter sp.]